MTSMISQLDAEDLASRSTSAGEPIWLVDRRRTAATRFAGQAWPNSLMDEFWRSTPFDVRFDVDRGLVAAGAGAAPPAGVLAEVEGGGVRSPSSTVC